MPRLFNFPLFQGRFPHRMASGSFDVSRTPTIVGLSDIGRARTRNEDSLCVLPDVGVAIVADGMGGHPGGDVASRIATETAAHTLSQAVHDGLPDEDAPGAMRSAMTRSVVRAHEGIRAEGIRTPELEGMGTTLTALLVDVASGTWVLGHVGDSRAYRFRDGELTQLTRDDTWVQERIEARQISEEQARHHPFAHLLTQCLGLTDPPVPHILDGEIRGGDVFLLCTDGLVGMLEDEEMAAILGEHIARNGSSPPDVPVQALVDAANRAGGHDNITAAIVHF